MCRSHLQQTTNKYLKKLNYTICLSNFHPVLLTFKPIVTRSTPANMLRLDLMTTGY